MNLWPFRTARTAPAKSPLEAALDARLAERRATRIAYRTAQSGRAEREVKRLRACRAKFTGEIA